MDTEDINLNGYSDAFPGSEISQTLASNKSFANIASDEQTRNVKKDKIENEKEKTKNDVTKTLKVASEPEKTSLKRKVSHPKVSEMVMDSIKSLKKRNGATLEDIRKHMEEKYPVNMKMLKSHINKFLQKGVDDGMFEKTDGSDAERRFKIKRSESIKKKDPKTARLIEKKVRSIKKTTAAKKPVTKHISANKPTKKSIAANKPVKKSIAAKKPAKKNIAAKK